MDIKARNKEVKRILSKEYGRKNVSVTGGKGTSWGWCYVEIKTPDPCPDKQHTDSCSCYCKDNICKGNGKPIEPGFDSARQETCIQVRNTATKLLSDVEFYHFYTDDNMKFEDLIINVRFE